MLDKWDLNISKDELFKRYKQKEREIEHHKNDVRLYEITLRLISQKYNIDCDNYFSKACKLVDKYGYISTLKNTRIKDKQ